MSAEQILAVEEPERPNDAEAQATIGTVSSETVKYGGGIAVSVIKDGLGLVSVACLEGLGSEVYNYEVR